MAVKYFCRSEVSDLAKDRAWLAKMTQTISQHWHKRNVRQNADAENVGLNGLS
jgi:hypothetical protein